MYADYLEKLNNKVRFFKKDHKNNFHNFQHPEITIVNIDETELNIFVCRYEDRRRDKWIERCFHLYICLCI